jgi:hypothetical protein
MKLADAVSAGKPLNPITTGHFFLNGHLEPDPSPEYIRVYPEALNKRRYYRVLKQDVGEDVYEWTEPELAHAGFPGQKRYRLALNYGSVIELAKISLHKVGETHPDGGLPGCKGSGSSCEVAVDCCSMACAGGQCT